MKLYRLSTLVVIVALLLAGFSPRNASAQAPAEQTIVEIALSQPKLSYLVAAVQAAGLVDTLNGPGTFTVFAPTNAAFDKLGRATLEALSKDPEALKNILLYHTLGETLPASAVLARSFATTLNGEDIVFSLRNGKPYVNNARITVTDVMASNGVVHIIDAVLLPPVGDIVDTAAANPNFKGLVAAVQAAGLVDTLKGEGPFTVFAPTDAAFKKLGRATLEALLADPAALGSILTYHVVAGKYYSGDILQRSSFTTVNGADLVFTMKNGKPYINNARITMTDIVTTNGVIHVIDTVVIPPSKDIVDTAVADPQLKALVAAVQAAGLAEVLKSDGPFTVFAPTNAAFAKLGRPTLEALLADPAKLASILTYHVVPGKVYSGDVVKLSSATTVNGADVAISLKNGKVYINNAKVIKTNILATNGVIHLIDTVLIPPAAP